MQQPIQQEKNFLKSDEVVIKTGKENYDTNYATSLYQLGRTSCMREDKEERSKL